MMFSISRRCPGAAISLLLLVSQLLFVAGCGLLVDNDKRLERASDALAKGDYSVAVINTKTVLESEPDNIDARVLLARASIGLYDGLTAVTNLRKAIELGAPLEKVAVDLGQALLMTGEYEAILEEVPTDTSQDQPHRHALLQLHGDARMGLGLTVVARSIYEEILNEDPANTSARLGVAGSHAAEGNFAAARSEIDAALELAADNVKVWLASGSVASDANDAQTALQHYTRALELTETSGDTRSRITALGGIVEANLTLGDLEAASRSMAPMLELAPDDVRVKYLGARTAFVKSDHEMAESALREVLQVAPSYIPARLLMGAVQFELGRLGQAESYISGVIAAAPRSQEARAMLAEIRMRQGRADEVAAILAPALEDGSASDQVRTLAVRASLQSGHYDTTISYLRDQLSQNPGNPDLRMQLAAALVVAGDSAEAKAILDDMPAGSDENEFRRELIRVYSLLGEGAERNALDAAKALAEKFPDDPRAHNLVANVALKLGRLELARASLAREQEILPQSLATYLKIAAIDIQAGRVDDAREQLTNALELQPESPDIMVSLARLEGQARNTDAAREWLDKARNVAPQAMGPRIFLARFLLSANDAAGAETVAREAVGIDANEPAAYNLLGLALERQGKLENAIASFEAAMRLSPDQADYRASLVRAQIAAGELTQAEDSLLRGGEINLDDIQQASMAAALRFRQGDLDGALAIADALKQRHPGTSAPLAMEAELLASGKQYEQAAEAYDRAIALSGHDRMLAYRAFVVRKNGGLATPEEPLLTYLRKEPADFEIRRNAALSFHSRGENDLAIEHFEMALEGAPNDPIILSGLAKALAQDGDSARAISLLEQALAASADFPGRGNAASLLEELRD